MSLFKPAVMQQGFLKMGIYGTAGCGKTYTSSLVALGLHKLIDSKKPVTFFDTETGSEYVLPSLFKPAGVQLQTVKSRAFSDLMTALKEAQGISDILIIDSVSHVWTEIMEAYKRKKGIDYVEFQDWAVLKKEWAAFTTEYLNCKLHVIVCGRSQDIWDQETNERGKKELVKSGTRMQTEKNLSYEPSLLVEMEKVIGAKSGEWTPRAWVLKDRFDTIDGKCFDRPTFETFLPHIQMLNLGGEHVGVDTSRSSEDLFVDGSNSSRYEYQKKRDIAIEEIKDEVDRRWSGMSVEQKNARIDVLVAVFGTSSKTAIENLPVPKLQEGLTRIRAGEFDQAGKSEEEAKPKANGAVPKDSKRKAA